MQILKLACKLKRIYDTKQLSNEMPFYGEKYIVIIIIKNNKKYCIKGTKTNRIDGNNWRKLPYTALLIEADID